jgi:hypothetical protein
MKDGRPRKVMQRERNIDTLQQVIDGMFNTPFGPTKIFPCHDNGCTF